MWPFRRRPFRGAVLWNEQGAFEVRLARGPQAWDAAVPSPGGWVPPPGVRPGWNWLPPDGGVARVDRAPLRVRVWYSTPFLDRWAHVWMWHHGGWDVLPLLARSDDGCPNVRVRVNRLRQ